MIAIVGIPGSNAHRFKRFTGPGAKQRAEVWAGQTQRCVAAQGQGNHAARIESDEVNQRARWPTVSGRNQRSARCYPWENVNGRLVWTGQE